MRNTPNCTRLSLILLLALALALPALGEGDIATDLSGNLTAADPAMVDAMGYDSEAPIEEYQAAGDLEQNADVVVGYIAPPGASINPTSCIELSLVSMNQLIYESVVDLDAAMKPAPMLADSWEHEGKTWTFKLRPGVSFHNGAEMTAHDVVRSWETFMSTYVDNPYFGRLQAISAMEATDIYTLQVTGQTAGMATLYAMNFPVMQYNTLADPVPRGSGPYWYIGRDDADNIRLEANPLWWKKQPLIHSILFKRYDDAGDAIQAVQTNRIDMVATVSPKAAFSRKLADLTSMDYTTLTYEMLIPNLSDSSIMSDIRMRQAVMYAIDRSVIASNAYLDMAVQCEVPVQPSCWLYESQSAIYYYSPERALQLLNSMGWYDLTGNGKLNRLEGRLLREPLVTILTYNESTNSIRENAANLIAAYLEAVGVNARVSVVSQSRLRENIKARSYDLALVGVNLSEVPNMSAIFGRGATLNLNGFGNDNMEMYLQQATAAGDEAVLKSAFSDMQMYVVNRLPIMGLLFRTGTVLSNRSLGGLSALRLYDALNGFEFLTGE
ncbi:MAG: hypothetical protein IJH86_09030 [Clostridia bacterium]|nr:hypothetical protein [Clostridia bacterium]